MIPPEVERRALQLAALGGAGRLDALDFIEAPALATMVRCLAETLDEYIVATYGDYAEALADLETRRWETAG